MQGHAHAAGTSKLRAESILSQHEHFDVARKRNLPSSSLAGRKKLASCQLDFLLRNFPGYSNQ
jgi:hypothetical protein